MPSTDRRARLTPLGAVLLVVLVASLIALFLGPRGVQAGGFTVDEQRTPSQ